VIRELLERDNRYREKAEEWVTGAVELKRLVQEENAPEVIVEHLVQLQRELAGEEN
jgi:hypothetical protein